MPRLGFAQTGALNAERRNGQARWSALHALMVF
jgi:hypothetical protein